MDGNCLIIRMKRDKRHSLKLLGHAERVLQGMWFDALAANLDGQIVIVALGRGHGTLLEIRERIPGIEKMEYGPFRSLDYAKFLEFRIFLTVEEKEREAKKEPEKISA